MPSPTLRRLLPIALALSCMLPGVANAYMTAEDVLLNSAFYLPPTKREGENRIERQRVVSAERRTREQEDLFMHAAPPPEEIPADATETSTEEVPTETDATKGLSSSDLELLRTIRLLDRITDRQKVLQYGAPTDSDVLHGGAPALAPTGAGAWLAAMTMFGAVAWTLRRAKRSERQVL
jgi:hypothetical protein